MAKKIPLTQGKFAIVDDENYEWLNQYRWFAVKPHKKGKGRGKRWYAARRIDIDKKCYSILMHREIMHADDIQYKGKRLDIHHFNENGLDNRKENMVLCLPSEHRGRRSEFWKQSTNKPESFELAFLNSALKT